MRKLKVFICVWAAITFIFMDLGLLFKIMHYPGAGVLLLLSMGVMMPVLIVFTAIFLSSKN